MTTGAFRFSSSGLSLKITSFVIACFFIWFDALIFNGNAASFPGAGFFNALAHVLSTMEIFFHELGHTITSWSFGSPAIPSFDFRYGGGMTYSLDRIWLLQYAVWVVALVGIGACLKEGHKKFAGIASGFLLLHIIAGLTPYYQAVISIMGHISEILLAVFLLIRASHGVIDRVVELMLNIVFGFFILGHGMVMFGGLYFSEEARTLYAFQKGGEILGDVDAFAAMTHISAQSISFAGMTLSGLLFGFFFWTYFIVKSK